MLSSENLLVVVVEGVVGVGVEVDVSVLDVVLGVGEVVGVVDGVVVVVVVVVEEEVDVDVVVVVSDSVSVPLLVDMVTEAESDWCSAKRAEQTQKQDRSSQPEGQFSQWTRLWEEKAEEEDKRLNGRDGQLLSSV